MGKAMEFYFGRYILSSSVIRGGGRRGLDGLTNTETQNSSPAANRPITLL